MRFWWVNQNQTYAEEIGGNYMWSPKLKANGHRNPFYDSMTKVEPGDVVFSFSNTRIKAVGVARSRCQPAVKPQEFHSVGMNWADEGWLVEVDFSELPNPIRPKDSIEYLRDSLPEKYSPLTPDGNGVQSVYLTEVPGALAEKLAKLLGADFDFALAQIGANTKDADSEANEAEQTILRRIDIGHTQIEQLVKARRGQGLFRTQVQIVERSCRVTGLELVQHLVASHIKPWKDSADVEKLDGNNGLMLSPHVDHLFDRGYISFESSGRVLVSPALRTRVLHAWHIDADTNVGDFNPGQQRYLAFHRESVFKAS